MSYFIIIFVGHVLIQTRTILLALKLSGINGNHLAVFSGSVVAKGIGNTVDYLITIDWITLKDNTNHYVLRIKFKLV